MILNLLSHFDCKIFQRQHENLRIQKPQYFNGKIVKMIVDVIEDINPKNDAGRTPLHNAIKYNHTSVCKIILPLIRFK